MKKKVISFVTAFVLLFSTSVPAFAASAPPRKTVSSGVHILFTNTDDAKAYLDFSGDRAECTAVVDGKTGTSKITATAYLKRVQGNTKTVVKAWTGLSATGKTFYFDKPYYVSSGYTYEFELDAGVYRNGTVEYITITDQDYCG